MPEGEKKISAGKNLVHIIDSLGFGGAEILLKNSVDLLPEFKHLIIYLQKPDNLKEQFPTNTEIICLNHGGWKNVFRTCFRLRKIIKERKPILVHTHLLNSTIITRLAISNSIPLVGTIHSLYSEDAFKKNKKGLWAERFSIKKQDVLIAVSNYVLNDYLQWVNFRKNSYVLYNFLPDSYFRSSGKKMTTTEFSCLAVGNLKEAKNYDFLLDVFSHLKNVSIKLDIYGTGSLEKALTEKIERKGLNITLKGHASNVQMLLPHYDLFVQASSHEGFGLSVIEAIAAKVPVLVSRIPVFEEITNSNAHFFELDDPKKAADKIRELFSDRIKCNIHVEKAFDFARLNFSSSAYREKLLNIYGQLLDN